MHTSRKHTFSFVQITNALSRRVIIGFALFVLAGAIASVSAIKLNAHRDAGAFATQRYIAPGGVNAGDCSNMGSPCLTLAYAISQSTTMNDTINAAAGTYVLTSTVNVNVANLTISGAGSATTIFQVAQAVGNAFSISAAGVTLTDLQIQKTDVTGVHELILVNASGDNFTLQNSLIQGPDPGTPWNVNNIVSRALVSSTGGVTGLLIQNNTIKYLRQPAYFNPGTVGTVSNNNVSGTRGWVVDGAVINFTGNTWGPPPNQGADIALLASCNPADYPNLGALSNANNNAFISGQFPGASSGYGTVYVDDSAAPGGDGTLALPFQTISAGVVAVLPGGIVNVAAGTYTELVNANKPVTLNGTGMPMVMAPAGTNQTIFTIAATNVTIQGFKISVIRPAAVAGVAAVDPAAFDGAQILNNTIQLNGAAGGSSFMTPLGNTSAAGIALLGNGTPYETVTIKGNTINSGDATNNFSRAIWLRELKATVGGATVADGNTLVGLTQDLLDQFASNGTTLIQNNTFNGAGIDITEPNNNPTTINIQNNQFAPGSPLFSQSCLIKHNYLNVPVNVTGNTFTGHTTGVWSGGSQNVTISGNSFTPATGLASYQNIRVDTAWPGTQVAPFNSNSVSISGNTLNGATGSSGVGVSFRNGQKANTTDPDFSSVANSGNFFNATLTEFMRLDNTVSQEFENNLDGSTSQYDVGAGLQLPSAMSLAQLAALENKVFHKLDHPAVGLVSFVANTIFVSSTAASGSTPTATDNDYTRINNAVQAAPSGTTIKLNGTFNWAETNAAASWALGSNGLSGDLDDYSILVPANRNNITFTANALGDVTIQGPGDLTALDLEGVFFFDSLNGSKNQNWTISNIRFVDFDIAIGMFFDTAGAVDAFKDTKIQNNYIKIAKDVAVPTETFQNIGIHFSFGKNQLISDNTIEMDGSAVSDIPNGNFAAEIGMQSNTSGGDVYDGLQITNNILRVLNAQSASPERIRGIWENSHGHLGNVTVSGNSFTNLAGGNSPTTNLQVGFRVTSHSSPTTTVKYQNNTVSGANVGFEWLSGSNFAGNQPVQLISNTITGNNTGVLIQSEGLATLKFNRIVGNTTGVSHTTGQAINAENNWWGCNFGPGAGGVGCVGTPNGVSNTGAGSVDSNPWLVLELAASPTTVPAGGMSALTASLKKNSDNVDTSLMMMGLFPDGVAASFSGTFGTVMPTSATTSSGMANSTYTAGGTPGAGSASSTVDGQTVTTPITVTAAALATLTFVQQPTNTIINGTITPAVTVQAKDAFNNNISSVSVTLSLSSGTGTLSGTLTQVTDGSGIATFNNLSIDMAGLKNLTAASGVVTVVSNQFTILPIPTIVYVDDNWVGTTPGADPDGGGAATNFGYDAFATIQGGVNAVASGGQVVVYAGTYAENLSVNKSVNLKGAQQGVNACGRSASESTITGSGTLLTLVTGSAGSIINGFTFSGGARGIESGSGPLDNLQIRNNRFMGFTGAGVFLNDTGTDITVDQNEIDGGSKTSAGGSFHLDTDAFDGFHFTNNCVKNAPLGPGLFSDGNRNVGLSAGRAPLFDGNVFENHTTNVGVNIGSRSVEDATFSNNIFRNNAFDGLQGGPLRTTFSGNSFINNGRHGLALTSFGNLTAGRGASFVTIKGNLISGNGFTNAGAGILYANQPAGTQVTNQANFNRIVGNATGVTNSSAEVIDVENNWWGCNFGPGTGGSGCSGTPNALGGTGVATIDANPWLTLTLMATPSTVAQFGTSTLASKLTINSNGADTAPMSMFVPNGTPVSYTQGALGSVAPTNSTTANGVANATYTAGVTPGNDSVSTTIDGQTVSTGITIGCVLITIAPTSIGPGTAGIPYPNTQLTATGGVGPHAFNILSGTLPNGMMLSPTGLISGTPLQVGTFNFVVKATDQGGCIGTQTYSLVINCPTVSLNPATLPNATINTAYNQTLTASPAGGNYSFAVTSGLLPAGLTLNSNGSFSGAPTQSGVFNFRVTATGFGSCTGFRDYTLTVDCPSITVNPSSLPGGSVGTGYSQAVSASPAGTYSFSVSSGALPTGLTLNASTGAITGTPTTTGSFTFVITATAGSCSGSRSYTVAIACPSISLTTTSPLLPGQAGVAYSQMLNVTPAGSYTFSLVAGNLPSGLTLNPGTGLISGTPATTGTSTFTVKAQGANGCSATQTYTLAIDCPAITVNPATLPSGTIGTAYAQTVTASPAGGSYTYAVSSGTLPTGLNLNPSTGLLSGTPSANGSFPFTITATGWGGCTGSRSYTITVGGGGGCPTITLPGSLPNGSVGQLYNTYAAASPSGVYNYTASGSLPPGVTLYNSIGLIFGFPTTPGSYTFTITATAGACSGSQTYTILISAGFASALTVFSDFDGDGKSDLSVFRGGVQDAGIWLVANSGDGQLQATPWGSSAAPYNDLTVSGDYDGDGKTDLAVFRRGGGQAGYWYIKRSSDGQVTRQQWGLGTDIPVPGDYDADGKTDIAVWRGSVGGWYILRSSDGDVEGMAWGSAAAGDIPVPGDYDGDSKTDVAVFRRGDGHWYIQRSSDGSTVNAEWGAGTDLPVPGDYDADGKTDLAVWRGSEGNWYIIESSGAALRTITLGSAAEGDIPVTADYDGDGKADAAIWRASTGTWTFKRSSNNVEISKTLGQSGDVPIVARKY